MNCPYKVIWKYKNDNRYAQYHVYIFIGDMYPHIEHILTKIQHLSFFDSLMELDTKELAELTNIYGAEWYNYFFNSHHINASILQINENVSQHTDLVNKFGEEWSAKHVQQHVPMSSKIVYTFSGLIKDEKLRKLLKKSKGTSIEDNDEQNFKLKEQPNEKQTGGNDDNDDDINVIETDDELIENDNDVANDDNDAIIDDENEEDLYQTEEDMLDIDVKATSALIEKAIASSEKVEKLLHFDQSKDKSMNIDSLKNVYDKHYVTTQYIFGDDTIRNIRDKICCSIKNNDKFGEFAYLFPSRQYLWTEYTYNSKVEKVMIGQKWLRMNELLDVDVEPDSRFYIYEELRDKLKTLRHNFGRYGSKIKREDDETNILLDYDGYITDNEIFMIDVYNELGKNYNPSAETLKNLQDVYFRLYFNKIRQDDIKNLLENLNGNPKMDKHKYENILRTIKNDLIIENEIVRVVEEVRQHDTYQHIFKNNYVTQTTIHVNVNFVKGDIRKLDLYRIFNSFRTSNIYPYVQYQTSDMGIVYKYDETEINNFVKYKENTEMLQKWFENAPYGLSFKARLTEEATKFMTIGLTETGRIEYKMMWQEAEEATIDDIAPTYKYVKNLLEKINQENPKMELRIPTDKEFKYAFINTIQKIEFPDKYTINHNDLSDFSRFFYPYVALIIEPKKRQSKIQSGEKKSKFGTYLRYKRVSKYENNIKIEQKIRYFMKNYEFQDGQLAIELAKQFNITDEKAMEHIEKVRIKYPALKKARKVLKKMDNLPQYKPPGIDINIQGKQREKYKIRISGAKSKDQLARITSFMNILLYLYIETYLYKKADRQNLKEKLKTLTNIAKRRSKVEEIVEFKETKIVKKMTKLDSRRIGFKPEKGHNQWTRLCQNSGNNKKRRPQQYNSAGNDLAKAGYSYNKKTDQYEKKVKIGKNKKKEVTLRTIKLPEYDQNGEKTNNNIHYACDPENNGEHMHVGFLTRSANPFGHCMPCCFKKDPLESNNKAKLEFFKQCMGKEDQQDSSQLTKTAGDKLYILQDTNKIQDGRIGYLAKYLDKYFNEMLDKTKKTRHHYLEECKTGYFFKYGTRQDEYPFLNAVAVALNMQLDDIKQRLIDVISADTNEQIFASLNNGDIKTQFETRERYSDFIKMSRLLDIEHVADLISLPSILIKDGLNIVTFLKKEFKLKKSLEKDQVIEDFYLVRTDPENVFTITDPKYTTIFLLNDAKNYYPIVMVKKDKISKTIETIFMFKFNSEKDNIVNHLSDFYLKNCNNMLIYGASCSNSFVTAKSVTHTLMNYDTKYQIAAQLIDARNKCKYLLTNGNILLPVVPSGSIWNIKIIKNVDKYIKPFHETFDNMMEIYKLSKKTIKIKPVGVYYEQTDDTDHEIKEIIIIAIVTKTKASLPVTPTKIKIKEIEELKLTYENKPLTDKIDNEILKGPSNYVIDDRISNVRKMAYHDEGYELFRLELSEFLSEEPKFKASIEKVINSAIKRSEKTHRIRLLLYKIIDKTLYDDYRNLIKSDHIKDDEDVQIGGKFGKFVYRSAQQPDLDGYQLNNDRTTCASHATNEDCSGHIFCKWSRDECLMNLTADLIIIYVNKVADELVQNNLKAFEILKKGNYFVSDIVDRTKFTEVPNQKIIKALSNNIKRTLQDILGKDNIPQIGKRKKTTVHEIDYDKLNRDFAPLDLKTMIIQRIIGNNISIFRAYANGYYWILNKYYDNDTRNIGYYSPLQSDMANNFRGQLIGWLTDLTDTTTLAELLKHIGNKRSIQDAVKMFVQKIIKFYPSNYVGELIVLSKLNRFPIVLFNDNNEILSTFDDGVYNKTPDKETLDSYDLKKTINMKFEYAPNSDVPVGIDVIYFK